MIRRRTALQLTPLLDLLLIVIFAQYLDVGARDRQRVVDSELLLERTLAAEDAAASARKEADAALLRLQVAEIKQAKAERELSVAANELRVSRRTEDALTDAAVALFKIDRTRLEEVLSPVGSTSAPATEEQREEIRRRLREVTSGDADAVVFHLMTHEELRKRVDLWRFHLDEFGVATLEAGGRTERFRVEPATLIRDIGQYADSLPEPKRLVVVLLTYSENARLITVEAVRDRLPRLMERLGQNSDSRFDYADLGFGVQAANGPVGL